MECTNPSFDEVVGTFHKRLELSLADRRQRNAESDTPKSTTYLVLMTTVTPVMENEGGACLGTRLPASAFVRRALAGRPLSDYRSCAIVFGAKTKTTLMRR